MSGHEWTSSGHGQKYQNHSSGHSGQIPLGMSTCPQGKNQGKAINENEENQKAK